MREIWKLPLKDEILVSTGNWFAELICKMPLDTCARTLMIAWQAWHARNEVTHNKPLLTTDGSRRFLSNYMASLGHLNHRSPDAVLKGSLMDRLLLAPGRSQKTEVHKAWESPTLGYDKLNIDGAYMENLGEAGSSIILKDHSGKIVFSACMALIRCGQMLEAELSACMEGIQLAVKWTTQLIMSVYKNMGVSIP